MAVPLRPLGSKPQVDRSGIVAYGIGEGRRGLDMRSEEESQLTRAALQQLLRDVAPNNYEAKKWGSLERIAVGATHRWLCPKHRAKLGK